MRPGSLHAPSLQSADHSADMAAVAAGRAVHCAQSSAKARSRRLNAWLLRRWSGVVADPGHQLADDEWSSGEVCGEAAHQGRSPVLSCHNEDLDHGVNERAVRGRRATRGRLLPRSEVRSRDDFFGDQRVASHAGELMTAVAVVVISMLSGITLAGRAPPQARRRSHQGADRSAERPRA